ncbi:hypothetical protein Poli38472_011915 [Pythium oligandrum]|uniref:Cyclic nucleotide-binding domain-containing protein n=1 Tax=Pythium oligandrum TaxID=41045 RepID=A0A8K1C844_PYTOL|nr:hypothetical protein Poli38472_011915 [Pythium oligandrum]|eukprot:TMW58327.1 hypothetical protein Poli38472_011915 [Pythium oligandrum]
MCALLYVLISIPFRIGFLYDPHVAHRVSPWKPDLTILTVMDVVTDAIGIYEFTEFYRAWKDAFAHLSESVSFELGRKLSKKANHRTKAPKISTRNRQGSNLGLTNNQAQWTLASIAPTASASAQVTSRRQKAIEISMEVIALIPTEIVVFAARRYNLLHVIRVTKLCRLFRISDYLDKLRRVYSERMWMQRLSFTGISVLLRNIALAAACCHYFACGYMLIAHQSCGINLDMCDVEIESSWVIRDALVGGSVVRKYARALYWASRTTVVLGYDDVTPVSDAETVYVVIVEVVAAVISTSILATFLFIFRNRNSRLAAFNSHVDNAREYMKSQNMPREIRRQVMSYFTYAWNTHHSLNSEEVLQSLPKHLQSKVVYTLKASRIKQVCFLMKESTEFINLLALALVHRVYIPEDSIIEPKINAKMFFVVRGTVTLSAFDGSHPKECQTGDFFADCCLLFPEKYEEKAIAKTFCELYVLEKSKFDEAIHHFYRGNEQATKERMVDTFEKYSSQLRKTKKLLGLRGGETEASSLGAGTSYLSKLGVTWRYAGSSFRIKWDLFRLLAIIYVAFEVPYYIMFISNHDAQKHFLVTQDMSGRYVVSLLIEAFFVVDLTLRSRVFGYVDPIVGLNVIDPSMVFMAYKANGFYTDLISAFPIALVMESLQGRIEDLSWMFRLLRLLRLRYVGDLLQDITEYYGISSKVQLILSLLMGVSLTLHMIACIWFEMSWLPLSWDDPQQGTALLGITRRNCLRMATNYQNCSWVRYDCYGHIGVSFPFEDTVSPYITSFAYIRSVYWAVVALTGVGYGDIVAFSTSESFFAAFWIFIGGIINFGIVGAMSSTLSSLMATEHHHVEKLNTLNHVMEHLGISEHLRGEIRRFYHHQFKNRKKVYESELLSNLPDQLCYRISSLLHAESTKQVTLFDSASHEFLEEVTGKFRHRTYQNGETLYIEGDICKEFLVITHGKINVFYQSKVIPIGGLHDGDCYGVNEFLLRQSHAVTLVAASPVSTSVMTREHFDIISRKYDEEMKDIRDEAFESWVDDKERLRRIARNFERLKLKPHVLSTTSMFYVRELFLLKRTEGKKQHNSSDAEAIQVKVTSIWNFVLTFWNTFNAFSIIFRICFHSHLYYSDLGFRSIVLVDLLCDAFFAMDIYLNLYYFDCEEVGLDNLLTRTQRNARYRRSALFKWHLAASAPIYYMNQHSMFVTSICRLPRLLRCTSLWAYIDEVIIHVQQAFPSQNVSSYLSPLKLLFFLLLGSHYAACIFFWISEVECERHPDYCWIEHDHLIHEYHHSIYSLYIRAFYWALTTLALVGSREIVPRNTRGTFWATFTCLGCSFVMGYILGELSELILDMDKEAKHHKSRIDSFEHFAKEHSLPENLRERVTLFFKIQFEHNQGKDLDEAVHDLSANLRLKLMHEIYGSAISLLPIRRFLSNAQVNNLALRLRTELFIPGDDIVVEDTFGSRLCIMRKGLGAVFWSESVTNVAVLMDGCLFGEVAFFLPNQRRIATVKATTSCEVVHIAKHAWNELWNNATTDTSDNHVQKYAMHAILDWVKCRVQCYQENTLTIAKRSNRHLLERRIKENLKSMMAPAKMMRTKVEKGRSFLTPQAIVLEKKAKYLLSQVDKYMAKRGELADQISKAAVQSRRSLNHDIMGLGQAVSGRFRSVRGHASPTKKSKKTLKTLDRNVGQFFAEVNPVNKHVTSHLDDHHLYLLEKECWHRYRYLTCLQRNVCDMMDTLLPQQTQPQTRLPPEASSRSSNTPRQPRGRRGSVLTRQSNRGSAMQLTRAHSFRTDDDPLVMRHERLKHLVGSRNHEGSPQKLFTTIPPPSLRKIARDSSGRFILGAATTAQPPDKESPDPHSPQREKILRRMRRCHSLPHFDRRYFEKIKHDDDQVQRAKRSAISGIESTLLGNMGINFDILQRCRRPKFSALYRIYRSYTQLHGGSASSGSSHGSALSIASFGRSHPTLQTRRSLVGSILLRRSTVGGGDNAIRWQKAMERRAPVTGSADLTAAAFHIFIKRLHKSWEFLMLFIALYHAVTAPLKIAFVHDLQELTGLSAWSGLEYVMDFLCLADVIGRLRRSSTLQHSIKTHKASTLASLPPTYEGFHADVIALFPMEIFVFAVHSYSDRLLYLDKWRYMCFFRLNKIVFSHRLQDLSESVFQYMVYDLKLPVIESSLYFLRSLAKYVLMAHWIACIWYGVSEKAYQVYSTSWLSTPGMLVFNNYHASSAATSAHGGAVDLHVISLERKYMRSFHFAMGSISTLFYGDVVSMNLIELLVEIMVILWSIYIYGALVGAHGEVLETHSRKKAMFEQNLSELQHYLLNNDVPKVLKKHIKQYYASIWRRRNGEEELAAIAGISRTLQEDVVYATLHRFAWKVSVFHSLDVHFLRALLVKLQYVICAEDEEVVIRGDVDRSMYFIAQGRILVKHDKSEITKEKGDFFGELALLYGIPRDETCIALSLAELYRLDHEPYEELLLDFPEYRFRNKHEWTTVEPPPSVLASLMQTMTLNGGGGSTSSVRLGDELADAAMGAAMTPSALLDEEIPRSFIFKSVLRLLSLFTHIDSLEAKEIIYRARAGARLHLKRLASIETSRPAHDSTAQLDPFVASSPRSPVPEKSTNEYNDIKESATLPGMAEDGKDTGKNGNAARAALFKREWTRSKLQT